MNAANRTKRSPFFIPDPWTGGRISGARGLEPLYNAISTAVNENAGGKLTVSLMRDLLIGLIRYSQLSNWPTYLKYAAGALRGKWRKALILDRLLADLYVKEWHKSRPDFSTVFLNAAAHIQHHYMFSSAAYDGTAQNPEWYIRPGADPLLEVYGLYDRIVGEISRFPDTRMILMTGLHQDPHDDVTYYYRLVDHDAFLRKIGMNFVSVEPRMSRDFLIRFANSEDARRAEQLLSSAHSADGTELFSVDNRGDSVFAMLTYPREIGPEFEAIIDGHRYADFDKTTAFVAIKNGQHNGIGYFLDTGRRSSEYGSSIPLTQCFDILTDAVSPSQRQRAA